MPPPRPHQPTNPPGIQGNHQQKPPHPRQIQTLPGDTVVGGNGAVPDVFTKIKPTLHITSKSLHQPSYDNVFFRAAATEKTDWPITKPLEDSIVVGTFISLFSLFAGVYVIKGWRALWDRTWPEKYTTRVKVALAISAALFLAFILWQGAVHVYALVFLYPPFEWDGRIFVHTFSLLFFILAMIIGTALSLREPELQASSMGLHGNARWATKEEVKAITESAKRGGVWLGDYKGVSVISPYHTITAAPTRSGKGVGSIIPNLLQYPGSVIVNDVKGENYFVTAPERRKMGPVHLLDPFCHVRNWDPTAVASSANWIESLDPNAADAVARARAIADAICIPPEGGGGDNAFFVQQGFTLVAGLIIWAAQLDPPDNNLVTVRKILTLPMEQLEQVMNQIQKEGVEPARRAAAAFWGISDKTRSSIQAEANNQLDFLDDERMAAALTTNTIPWERMKAETHTVYISIPPGQINQAKRFIRLIFGQALDTQMRIKGAPKHNILYCLDEFSQLGYFRQIEESITVVAGYGITIWCILQDLSQLKHVYKKWESFLANMAQQYFKATDMETVEYVSKMLGKRSVKYKSNSINGRQGIFNLNASGGGSTSYQHQARELMTTDEVQNSPDSIIKLVGEPPILAQRVKYFEDPRWKSKAAENPFLHETVAEVPPDTKGQPGSDQLSAAIAKANTPPAPKAEGGAT